MTWPIKWPDAVAAAELDPNLKRLCEVYASACMNALTLHRVGGDPITLMPGGRDWLYGHYVWFETLPDLYPIGTFYPGTIYPSAQELQHPHTVEEVQAIVLPGPVGNIVEVKVDGVVLDPAEYRVEDGKYLVRLGGKDWPDRQGDNFTVKYYNSHPVDEMGQHAAGVMANEWLQAFTPKGKCRLPASATTVSRQGITIERAAGMFPEGTTGIPEIDAYLMLWNPHGLKVAPRVYSPDIRRPRQVWSA